MLDRATAGAGTVTRLLMRAVKSARYNRLSGASGDYGFIAERFYRETEAEFYKVLGGVVRSIEENLDADDPTIKARESWAPVMEVAALRLFDEYAFLDGLEDRSMHRHVKARFFLALALRGHGKQGRLLFERDLAIASPETAQTQKSKEAA